jgi:hypothetical protein
MVPGVFNASGTDVGFTESQLPPLSVVGVAVTDVTAELEVAIESDWVCGNVEPLGKVKESEPGVAVMGDVTTPPPLVPVTFRVTPTVTIASPLTTAMKPP